MTLKIVDFDRVNQNRDYISFSEIHLFSSCPFKHDLTYNQGIRDDGSFYTMYGSALHEAIEQKWKYKNDLAWLRMGKIVYLVSKLNSDETNKFAKKTPSEWVQSSLRIYKDFFPWMEENFPDCELFDIEYELKEPLEGFNRHFKGYIDLILYNSKEDIYHIIDLKTSGWGWGKDQLSDTKKLYQVILYKSFFCNKENIPREKVKCHYLLLLRGPPKNKSSIVLHSMTSGNKKLLNAEQWMYETLELVKKGIKLKNPSTCSFCTCGAKKWTPKKRS